MKLHAHSSVIPNINISILTFSLFEKLNSAFVFYIWFDIINLQRGFTVIRTVEWDLFRSIFLQDCIPRSIQYWHCNLTVLDISSSSWNIREQKTKRTFDCNLKNFEVQNLNSSSLKLTDRKTNIAPNRSGRTSMQITALLGLGPFTFATSTPTQKLKSWFPTFSSQGIGSS